MKFNDYLISNVGTKFFMIKTLKVERIQKTDKDFSGQDKVENEFYFYRKQKKCRISPKQPEISLFQVVPEEVIEFDGLNLSGNSS